MLHFKYTNFHHLIKISGNYHYRFYLFYFILMLIFLTSTSSSQVYSNLEAKEILYDLGVSPLNIIENVKIIKVKPGLIEGFNGGYPRKIYKFVNEDDIILLKGATAYETEEGEILIIADYLFISAVLIKLDNRWYLIVGRTLYDIVNFLVE